MTEKNGTAVHNVGLCKHVPYRSGRYRNVSAFTCTPNVT